MLQARGEHRAWEPWDPGRYEVDEIGFLAKRSPRVGTSQVQGRAGGVTTRHPLLLSVLEDQGPAQHCPLPAASLPCTRQDVWKEAPPLHHQERMGSSMRFHCRDQ